MVENLRKLEVTATSKAIELIEKIKNEHGPILFHQSGGCCDGSTLMCFLQSEFLTGDSDYLVAEIAGCPVYMHASQYEYYKHTKLIIDAESGRAGIFSLEGAYGMRFTTRSIE
ncbi:MAG TPA: DUF779 domain-containing protein [Bacilli bacterium]|nr:DUF779 domain-containing protein [Bacilli bacterium]